MMDPTQQAQLQQLQQMYGPPSHAFQPQPFQVQPRPLAPAGGQGQGAPSPPPSQGAGGGGGQQGGGQPSWAQTLMPLMKGLMGQQPQRPTPPGATPLGAPGAGGGMAGPPIVQNQGQMGPFMNQMAPPGGINPGGVTNGIVNSWPYPR